MDDGAPLTALSLRVLTRWKRSTSALTSHRSSSVDQLDLRATRSSLNMSRPLAEDAGERPSMVTGPSSVHSRGSAFSGVSGPEEESRRRSTIRFELGEDAVAKDKGVEAAEVARERPSSRLWRGHQRNRDSKGDCLIM